MNHVWIPEGYRSCLGLYDTQKAIGLIKNLFQQKLCLALHLKRVTAPLFVEPSSGLNDDLNGVERPVGFDIQMCIRDRHRSSSSTPSVRQSSRRDGNSSRSFVLT